MSAPLISVRAGRSLRRGDSKTVEAQPSRGLLYLTEEDGLTHFCWKDGESNATVDDLILFPGDASFRSLSQSPRTCALRFSSSDAVHFYWLQDPDASTDAAHISAINQLLQAPEEENEASNEDVHMEGFTEPRSEATPSTGPTESTSQRAQLDALLKAFQNESGSYGAPASSSSSSDPYAGHLGGSVPYTLPDVATPASLAPLLADKAVQERLRQHLPPGLDDNNVSESTLRSVVHSPEIKRSLASLDSALRTGALGPLVQSLGLKQEAALSVDQFLQAIQEKVDKEKADQMDMS